MSHRHGRHSKVVGLGDPGRLADAALVATLLASLPGRLGMRALGPPIIHDVELSLERLGREPLEDEGGITGVCVLSTSHCAVHTWPARSLFVLDAYSCRDFSPTELLDAVREAFGATAIRMTDLSHALTPPQPVEWP